MSTSWEESFGYCTVQTGRNITRFLTLCLKNHDITPEQWTVIKRLADQDGISQKELSRNVDKDQATLTRILDILERKELIQKQMNKEDRRSFLIYLTDRAERSRKNCIRLWRRCLNRCCWRGFPNRICTYSNRCWLRSMQTSCPTIGKEKQESRGEMVLQKQKLWNRDFISIFLSNFFIFTTFYTLLATLPMFVMETLDGTDQQVGLVMTSFIIAAVIFRPIAGKWVDELGRKKILLIFVTVFVLSTFLYLSVASVIFFAGPAFCAWNQLRGRHNSHRSDCE